MPATNRIRVLHFANLVNRYDFIDNVVRHLDPVRFEAEVATFHDRANIQVADYAADDIPHTILKVDSRRDYPIAALSLRRLVRNHDIDILHAHHFDPNAVAWLATELKRSVRVVVGRHYSDAIYRNTRGLKRQAYLGIERLVNTHAACIVAPSTMIQDLLVARQQVPEGKVKLIPYPFDPTRYEPVTADERQSIRSSLGVSTRFAVATVARLYHDKGHRYLVQALQTLGHTLPDLAWLVIGDGPERPALEQAIRQAALGDRVKLLGWRPDATRIIGAVDAVIQPSLQEAYSQVMAETLWMGTPLVISDVSGASDLITPGETGLIVPRGDAQALASAISILYRNPDLRARLGQHGRLLMEVHHSIDAILPRFEEVYEEVIA